MDPQLNPNKILVEEFGEEPVEPELIDRYFAQFEPSVEQRSGGVNEEELEEFAELLEDKELEGFVERVLENEEPVNDE